MGTITSHISTALAWQASHAYSSLTGGTGLGSATIVSNGSAPARAYVLRTTGTSAASGGPSGTGTGIVDGTCVWDYLHDIDFSSWNAWAATIASSTGGDLVKEGNSYVGLMYADAEISSGSTTLSLSGHTTDATHTITCGAAPGHSFRDQADAGTNPLTYDRTKGAAISYTAGYGQAFSISDANVFIKGLQIRATPAGGGFNAVGGGADTTVDDCILVGGRNGAFGTGASGCVIRNSTLISTGNSTRTDYNVLGFFGSITVINCTLVCPSDAPVPNSYAIAGSYANNGLTIKNCLVYGFGAGVVNNAAIIKTSTSSTNQTDIASPPTSFTTQPYASQFVSITSAGFDLRLTSGAPAIGAGTADTTNSAFDIVGTPRPQGTAWDVGAWELVGGPPPPAHHDNFMLLGVS